MLEEIKAKYKDDAALIRRLESVEKELEELRRDQAISEDLLGIAYKNLFTRRNTMTKELEAFVRIARQLKVCDENGRDLDIIETALKQQKNDREIWKNYLKKIKNLPPIEVQMKLKALEIIKEKRVDLECLFEDWEEENWEFAFANYNFNNDIALTKEEYDLLKEVLM